MLCFFTPFTARSQSFLGVALGQSVGIWRCDLRNNSVAGKLPKKKRVISVENFSFAGLIRDRTGDLLQDRQFYPLKDFVSV
jgi:hypothetical protein